MRLLPEGAGEHELALLPGRKRADEPLRRHLLGDAEGLEVLADLAPGERALLVGAARGGEALVQRFDELLHLHLAELREGLVGVLLLVVEVLPLDLVVELLAFLVPRDKPERNLLRPMTHDREVGQI